MLDREIAAASLARTLRAIALAYVVARTSFCFGGRSSDPTPRAHLARHRARVRRADELVLEAVADVLVVVRVAELVEQRAARAPEVAVVQVVGRAVELDAARLVLAHPDAAQPAATVLRVVRHRAPDRRRRGAASSVGERWRSFVTGCTL